MPTSIVLIAADDHHTHVRIVGPLDLAGVHAVELKFAGHTASRRKPTIVDLSEVEIVVSLAMGMLVQVARALSGSGARLVLLAPTPRVEGAIRAARLETLLPLAPDLSAARDAAGLPRS
ncbi:MAG: STAS domain-containing protein [Phycisphaerales bacterium]